MVGHAPKRATKSSSKSILMKSVKQDQARGEALNPDLEEGMVPEAVCHSGQVGNQLKTRTSPNDAECHRMMQSPRSRSPILPPL